MLFCEQQVRAQSLRQQVNVYIFLVKILLFHYAINDGIFPFCVGFSLLSTAFCIKMSQMFSRRLKIFQGQNVRENSSAGVLIVEQSLVIRRVSRLHSGRYSCTAINTEGTGLSNTVQLRVMCKWSPWNPFSLFHTFFKKLIDYIDELQFSRSAGQIRNFFTEWPNKKRPLSDAKLTPFHR
jgi:hypothetical protein